MLNELHNLVKEAGFGATIVLGQPSVQVFNSRDEIVGQFVIYSDHIWFYVYDTSRQEITPEGGQCKLELESIKNIISEFRYR